MHPARLSLCLSVRPSENDYYIFVLIDLDLKFAPLVTLVQRYVSVKLEVSTAFLFENRRHWTADGRTSATINAAPRKAASHA